MRKMMRYGKSYGDADPEMIEGDVFRIVVKVPEFGRIETKEEATNQITDEVSPEVTPEVTPEVRKMLSIMTGEMTRGEIQKKLGLRDEKHFRENYQQIGVKLGLIEMTIPDKPRSRLQKYRLTDSGKHLLKSMQE
jgi:ATP-dependent DNA helicase RecG